MSGVSIVRGNMKTNSSDALLFDGILVMDQTVA